MDKQIIIDSIKNFLSMNINTNNISGDIKDIISKLSTALSEDFTSYISSVLVAKDNEDPQTIADNFLGNINDLMDDDYFKKWNNDNPDEPYAYFPSLTQSEYSRKDFTNITPYSGFDGDNPQNARQNNYAWSFVDFDGYIYVGTGRNLVFAALTTGMDSTLKIPLDYTPSMLNMGAEIWRYKKDGSLPWQKVYSSSVDPDTNIAMVIGIRSLIKFDSFSVKPALYAAAYSMSGIKILKSTNGVDWFDIPTGITQGTSSRSMMIYNDKIYLAVMSDGEDLPSLLYSSKDPELYGWTLETPEGNEGSNPKGTIWSMASFNNHIYLGTSSSEGFMVWRTNGDTPKINEWKLVIDKGAGDTSNATAISLVEFNDYLYVGTAYDTFSFISYVVPKGAEIIRIDKDDKYRIVVGGPVMKSADDKNIKRNHPLSGYANGFFNPYNLYIWQMKVYNNKLFVGTYDSSAAVEPTYELLIKNKEMLSQMMSPEIIEILILFLRLQILVLSKIKKFIGFDFYVTEDGINYEVIDIAGFGNPHNYGIRNIFVSDDNIMYIGTANPFSGCEVYELNDSATMNNNNNRTDLDITPDSFITSYEIEHHGHSKFNNRTHNTDCTHNFHQKSHCFYENSYKIMCSKSKTDHTDYDSEGYNSHDSNYSRRRSGSHSRSHINR